MRRLLLVVAVLSTSVLTSDTTASAASCAEPAPGGEWRSFGHDTANTRHQPLEDTITPATATMLQPVWATSIADAGGAGTFQSVPSIADGCVYAGTNLGWVIALNADTGETVWATELAAEPLLAGLSGGIFGVTVAAGRVYANVSANGAPTVAALDQNSGDVLWATAVDDDPSAYTNSSAALINGMVFIGISGPEDGPGDRRHPGGFALLDPATGEIIKRTYTVSEADDAIGEKGASLWGTAVWDQTTNYVYDGTGQPANKDDESRFSNALLQIDVDPSRPTFGEIVDLYKGNTDSALPEQTHALTCRAVAPVSPLGGCMAFDVDFGASPNLFTDSDGRTLVGALQKSGTYHAAYTDNMVRAWTATLSGPLPLGNAGTAAFDGTSIYVKTTPGLLYSLDASTGYVNWVMPVADAVDYHPVTVAGGVVYVVSAHGLLLGFDASNGLPVLVRPMAADAGDACVNLSAGVSVARNTVYAHCDTSGTAGGWIVAYAS